VKILFLGGTGNISTEVAALLHRRGHEVAVVTRGQRPVPKEYRQIIANRYDLESLRQATKDWTGDAVLDFICFKKPQAEIAYNVFRGRAAQYCFVSTAMVYQKPPIGRIPATEDLPQGNAYSEYATAKIECEAFFRQVAGPDFPVTVIRPSHTLGRGRYATPLLTGDYTLIKRIADGRPVVIHDDGQWLWTTTSSADFAVGMAGLVGNPKAIGEAFHITSDQAVTWNCLFFEMGQAIGREPNVVHIPTDFLCREFPQFESPLKGDRAAHSIFDNTKIKRFAPGFQCRMSPRDIIRDSFAWYDEDPARRIVNAKTGALLDSVVERWRKAQTGR